MTRDTADMFAERERGRFGDNEIADEQPQRLKGGSKLHDITLTLRNDTKPLAIAVSDPARPGSPWIWLPKGAAEFEGRIDVRLPYPICLFEFRVSGHRVALIANEARTDDFRLMASVETPLGWCFLNLYSEQLKPLKQLMDAQVRAICVALEAEVARTEVIRAPHKLNIAREKRGKLIIPDYHVVSLSRRSRPSPLPASAGDETGRRVRLHFRRGHWRHFDNHKTWIKWTLVGDPDLGFIEKHYRL